MFVYLCYVGFDDGWEEGEPRLCKITSSYSKAVDWTTQNHGDQYVSWFESVHVEE